MKRFVLALDQGTTSSRAILFDHDGAVVGVAQEELPQHYPRPGWVEHEPEDIWRTQIDCARRVLASTGTPAEDVAAIGIANQRETTIVWDRKTGVPIHRAIVWQCRRTAQECQRLKRAGGERVFARQTGLVLDPYFSGTKIAWILDHVPGARRRAARGELAFGTVDSWLIWRLTRGAVHATDPSNASRTLAYDLRRGAFDDGLLARLRVPRAVLPEIRPSSGDFGTADPCWFGAPIPLGGVAGDQQAALFGQACFRPGMVKNTYGTGCFLLMNVGSKVPRPKSGVLATVAWTKDDATTYALEGSVFVAGAAVQWLRDALKIIGSADETEGLARSLAANDGVYFVPAFVGLGTPHWDPTARGAIFGLTRGTGRAHLARAALEAMAFQTRDLVDAMTADAGVRPKELRVDGGAARNDFVYQFQADVRGIPLGRPMVTETTALGAAYLAGLSTGFWQSERELAALWRAERRFEPTLKKAARDRLHAGWLDAVSRTLTRR